MKIAVFGATGGTGSVVVRQLLAAGRDVRATARGQEAAARLRSAGAEAVLLDLASSSPAEIEAALGGCEVVINAAAGRTVSGRQARRVDRDGVIRAIDAAERAGVRRWVQISMMGSDDPRRIPLSLRFLLWRVAAAKGQADAHLVRSGLVWTVIRPPWLTDGGPTGHVTVARNLDGGSLSRGDLAAVAIACVDQPATHHRLFDLSGGDVPMDRALASVAELS
ncbi:SDR family oxidoreductase [Streptomyces millisiae]|uniref:SDR family oxidoreductase n=1 Tax=Streptomyces millisiae TaxID=3075542 RepID=A0ABU2LIA7_9ACTN|nr:SDR family oxidoreductase [Streptomyces sp. DSM 44918]MDT0317321.1 SDR family oxidoreductase [Streptomyces sp. DSM 44918]